MGGGKGPGLNWDRARFNVFLAVMPVESESRTMAPGAIIEEAGTSRSEEEPSPQEEEEEEEERKVDEGESRRGAVMYVCTGTGIRYKTATRAKENKRRTIVRVRVVTRSCTADLNLFKITA